jgi:hypothetical protein
MSSDMERRAFLRNAAAAGASLGFVVASKSTFANARTAPASTAPGCVETSFPQVQELTAHTAEFVVNLKFADIPTEPLELGKKSILDCLGLALSGSKAETWRLIQEYLKQFGFPPAAARRCWDLRFGFLPASPPLPTVWPSTSMTRMTLSSRCPACKKEHQRCDQRPVFDRLSTTSRVLCP